MCADICACDDKRCPSRTLCYRFTCEKDEFWQGYFVPSPRKKNAVSCDQFWANSTENGHPDPTDMTVTQKCVTQKEYCKRMDAIIGLGMPIQDTLIALLEEAGKYKLSQKEGGICAKKYTKKGAIKAKKTVKASKKRLLDPKGCRVKIQPKVCKGMKK